MSAEELSHAEKVKRGMELSRAHKAGEHTEPNPDCAKCTAEGKKVGKGAVPNAEAEVTLEGVSAATQTLGAPVEVVGLPEEPKPEKSEEQKNAEHKQAVAAAAAADQEAKTTIPPIAGKPGEVGGDKVGYDILVHILKDGFTALGAVWFRGQEIGIKKGSPTDQLSTDMNGNHWYDMTTEEQFARFGEQVFGIGPWPYDKPDISTDDGYIAALASGDADAVRRYEKQKAAAARPPAPAGDRT